MSTAAAAAASVGAARAPPSGMEVTGEDGTSAAAADEDATRVVDALGTALVGVAPEATTQRPNDFRSVINWVALIPSRVVLLDDGAFAFSAYDTVG